MAVLNSRTNVLKKNAFQVFTLQVFVCLACLFILMPLSANELFPVPAQIEKNVEFWTKIYSQYSSNHVVIHDKNDLAIIYKVINLNDYYPDSLSLKTKWETVETVKAEYRQILQRLSQMTPPFRLDSLTREERHVYIVWAQSDDPFKFRNAIYAVRAQVGLRDRFAESIKRSGFYKKEFEDIFTSYGLPLELTYLPHVESLFNYKAYSKVGAAGIWQFMRYTGRLFMTVDYAVDERLDPITATDGAARLLKRNYEQLKSWPLAITAYNHGLGGMQRAVERHGTTDFGEIYTHYQSSSFGFASKNFYAEFLAASHVAANYKTYFGAIEAYPARQYQSVKLHDDFYLNQLVETFSIPKDTLAVYNPAFRHAVIANRTRVPKGYNLRMPYREGFDPRENMVQRTKPAPDFYRAHAPSHITLANATPSDTTTAHRLDDASMEDYIMKKLQMESTPTLLKNKETDAKTPVSLQSN